MSEDDRLRASGIDRPFVFLLLIGAGGILLLVVSEDPVLKYFFGGGSLALFGAYLVFGRLLAPERSRALRHTLRNNSLLRLAVEAGVFGTILLAFGGPLVAAIVEPASEWTRLVFLFLLSFASYKLGQVVGPRLLLVDKTSQG